MRIGLIIGLVMALGSSVMAQVTPEEAAKRLQEKAAARAAERSKTVTITQGELDDLRAEIVRLRGQVSQLHGSAPTSQSAAASAVKLVPKIAVGITRAELMRFVQVHKSLYEITAMTKEGDKDILKIQGNAKRKIATGVSNNGINRFQDYHEEMRPDMTYTVAIAADHVTAVSSEKLPPQADELR